jgi:hypothetical protein
VVARVNLDYYSLIGMGCAAVGCHEEGSARGDIGSIGDAIRWLRAESGWVKHLAVRDDAC